MRTLLQCPSSHDVMMNWTIAAEMQTHRQTQTRWVVMQWAQTASSVLNVSGTPRHCTRMLPEQYLHSMSLKRYPFWCLPCHRLIHHPLKRAHVSSLRGFAICNVLANFNADPTANAWSVARRFCHDVAAPPRPHSSYCIVSLATSTDSQQQPRSSEAERRNGGSSGQD